MKKTILFFSFLMILATSCEKDQDVISSDLIIQNENISSFYKCAIIESELESWATLSNIFIEYSILDKNDYQQIEIKKIADKYYAVITNLIPNTSYKYQYNASNRFSSKTVETNSIFTTLPNTSIPAVLTDTASKITKSSATVQGYVIDDGGENITEFGVVYATSSFPTINDHKVSLTTANWDFTVTLTNLNAETIYYVRTYAVNNKGVSYGNQLTFTTVDNREYVDLGLSVKWATCNVGATKPEEYGDYFACGETEPKEVYNWSTYKWCNGSSSSLTKYCISSSYGIVDNKTTLELSDDAAAVNWGGDWRMPTKAEQDELREKCTWTWTSQNGVNGYRVTSRSNGKSIFLPAAGYRDDSSLNYAGSSGYYWSSALGTDYPYNAWSVYFSSDHVRRSYDSRCFGRSVRPVYGAREEDTTNETYFSVSATKKVTFSPGNLQYHPADKEWRFAENQTDHIGDANSNCSSTYNGWLDLFGWSTSATNFGVSTSSDYTDYSGSFVDWGRNKIGSDAPNTWRTLTYNEWEYLLNTRPNASSLKGLAQVNGVNGLILLPDNWTCPAGVTFKSGFHRDYSVEAYGQYQTFTADQWTKLEIAGAVFLPAAGFRYGYNDDYVQYYGYYWSATEDDSGTAYCLLFYSGGADMGTSRRDLGQSVRLVKDL